MACASLWPAYLSRSANSAAAMVGRTKPGPKRRASLAIKRVRNPGTKRSSLMPAAASLARHSCAWLASACANCRNKSLRRGSASAAASAVYSAAPLSSSRRLSRYRLISAFIIFLREKRWPSGRRGIATRVARHVSHGPHFSMFADLLVYCMDVQLSTYRCSGPAPAGEGQTCLVALGLGARGQHGLQLLQRTVGESVRARTSLFVWIRFLAVPQRGHAR